MTTVSRSDPPTDAEVWLSVHDAAAMLGVSSATLRRWCAHGDIEAFTTPGGHRRYALSAIRALQSGLRAVRARDTDSDVEERCEACRVRELGELLAGWADLSPDRRAQLEDMSRRLVAEVLDEARGER